MGLCTAICVCVCVYVFTLGASRVSTLTHVLSLSLSLPLPWQGRDDGQDNDPHDIGMPPPFLPPQRDTSILSDGRNDESMNRTTIQQQRRFSFISIQYSTMRCNPFRAETLLFLMSRASDDKTNDPLSIYLSIHLSTNDPHCLERCE